MTAGAGVAALVLYAFQRLWGKDKAASTPAPDSDVRRIADACEGMEREMREIRGEITILSRFKSPR